MPLVRRRSASIRNRHPRNPCRNPKGCDGTGWVRPFRLATVALIGAVSCDSPTAPTTGHSAVTVVDIVLANGGIAPLRGCVVAHVQEGALSDGPFRAGSRTSHLMVSPMTTIVIGDREMLATPEPSCAGKPPANG